MPGKPRQRQGKYSFQARKGVSTPASERLDSPQTAQPAVAPEAQPALSVEPSVAVKHPFIAAELRTISFLAVIMVIILAVLAMVIS